MEHPRRILIVEDNLLVAKSFASALQDAGMEVTIAGSGEEAWTVVTTDPMGFDLAVLDVNLTGISGEQVLVKIREFAPYLRVLMTSGYVSDETRLKLLQLGAAGFIGKPVFPADLVAEVRRWLPA